MAGRWRYAAAAVLLAVLMAGGSARAADEPVAAAPLAGTTWRAETITGRPVIDAAASTIAFEADGRVSGRGGCNRYFGTSTIAGEQLSFGAVGATRMACAPALMDQEARFFQALGSAERWIVDADGLLLIYSAGADQPSRFAPFEQ
jgi:heat shock protein HslJ